MNNKNESAAIQSDKLDIFLETLNSVPENNNATVYIPHGIDLQLERHYLAITGLVSSQILDTRDQINAISTFLEQHHDPSKFRSRVPGVSFIHRIIGRLVRRHFSDLVSVTEQIRITLNMMQDSIENLFLSVERFQSLDGDYPNDLYVETIHQLELEIGVLRDRITTLEQS